MGSNGKVSLSRKRVAKALRLGIERHCEATGDHSYDIAAELGVSAGHLSNIGHGREPLSVDTLVRLTRLLDDSSIIEAVCHECGGSYLSLPRMDYGSMPEIMKAAARSAREGGEAVETALKAIADGKITPEEREHCAAEIGEAIRSFDALRREIESAAKPNAVAI